MIDFKRDFKINHFHGKIDSPLNVLILKSYFIAIIMRVWIQKHFNYNVCRIKVIRERKRVRVRKRNKILRIRVTRSSNYARASGHNRKLRHLFTIILLICQKKREREKERNI